MNNFDFRAEGLRLVDTGSGNAESEARHLSIGDARILRWQLQI